MYVYCCGKHVLGLQELTSLNPTHIPVLPQGEKCTDKLTHSGDHVGKSVASGERYYIRETNVWRDRAESGVGHVGQLSTAQ